VTVVAEVAAIVVEAAVIVAEAVAIVAAVLDEATSCHVVIVVVAEVEDKVITHQVVGATTLKALAEDRCPFMVVSSGEVDLPKSTLASTCKLKPHGSNKVSCTN
jgi:hypothetical protein